MTTNVMKKYGKQPGPLVLVTQGRESNPGGGVISVDLRYVRGACARTDGKPGTYLAFANGLGGFYVLEPVEYIIEMIESVEALT